MKRETEKKMVRVMDRIMIVIIGLCCLGIGFLIYDFLCDEPEIVEDIQPLVVIIPTITPVVTPVKNPVIEPSSKEVPCIKEKFIDYMLPMIQTSNEVLKVKGYKPIPPSLVLAQTIIESNWGRSRFAREANNLFGIHSFNGKGMKPIKGDFMVRVYDNHTDSLMDYMLLLHKGTYFKGFQGMHKATNDPFILSDTLYVYSERGQDYIDLVQDVIRHNDLTRFDI